MKFEIQGLIFTTEGKLITVTTWSGTSFWKAIQELYHIRRYGVSKTKFTFIF